MTATRFSLLFFLVHHPRSQPLACSPGRRGHFVSVGIGRVFGEALTLGEDFVFEQFTARVFGRFAMLIRKSFFRKLNYAVCFILSP